MNSPFAAYLDGRQACFKIDEDENHLAFLSTEPLREGHTLVIPKIACDALFDMEPGAYTQLMLFAQKAAQRLKRAIACTKVGMIVAGVKVRHVHLHLVPIEEPTDLDFSKAAPAEPAALGRTQEKIMAAAV
ncbi:MAG: hypothetical protein A2Y02_03610 [Omnitrophica bacterium GWA2_52_12]|nr:MAG: hypothetical protein A2Y02_03610 [Omnitrophica bacterium GWA2_52_12]